jgi:UDP-N-acetylglucosamine acyltransferase
MQREDINELKLAYRKLFESGKPLKDSANELLATTENEHVKRICQFALDTKRGIPYERKNV